MDAPDSATAVGAADALLDERYRLLTRVRPAAGAAADGAVWRARDEVLRRTVAVRLLDLPDADTADHVIATVTHADRLGEPHWARILDVGVVGAPLRIRRDAPRQVWVASEWLVGSPLDSASPLPPADAVTVARRCVDALGAVLRARLPAPRLTAADVVVADGGSARVVGVERAALTPFDDARDEGAAVVAVGEVLHAALGRSAPAGSGRGARRAWHDADDIARKATGRGYRDLGALNRALAVLPAAAATPAGPPREPRWLPWAWRIVPPVVVAAVAVAAWAAGSRIGNVPGTARHPRPVLPTAAAGSPGVPAPTVVWRSAPAISSFDPQGDGVEGADTVALAVDSDPTTAWETDRYRGNSHFGGLKDGVGLLLDLGRPTTVREAQLALTAAGADVELRAGDVRPAAASDLALVAAANRASTSVTLHATKPVRARYWLLWFTSLPPDAGGYRVGVAEVALLG